MKLREHLASLPLYDRWSILGTILGIIIGLSIITLVKIIEILSLVFIKPFGLTYLQIIRGKIKIPLILFFPLIAGLGGLLTGIIATKLAPETLGAGTDYAIEVFHFREGRIRWRVWFLKIITSALTLGSGASAGDEGPSALIGAGIGSFLANLLGLNKEDRRIAVAVGIGAGIGSVFKAPIGGAVLSAEVLYKKDIEPEVIYPDIITSAVSYSIVGLILGYSPIFGYYTYTFSPLRLPLYAILGFLAGLIAILYVKTYRKVRETFVELKAPNILKPALGGLISGLLAIIFPEIISSGYAWDKAFELGLINEIPTYGLPLLLILVLLPFIKIIATSFSVGSGESGGLFAPSLMIVGSLGLLIGLLFHHLFPSLAPYVAPFVLIGMLSVLSERKATIISNYYDCRNDRKPTTSARRTNSHSHRLHCLR